MAGQPKPKPCFLDGKKGEFINGEKRWRSANGRYFYTWDSQHGEIEWYDKQGRHLGVLDAVSGLLIKPAVPGRTINVR